MHHFPNADEIAHLPAGVSHWEFGRFDLYRVNPPLARTIAGLPAWLAGNEYDWSLYSNSVGKRPEFDIGRAKLAASRLAIHKEFVVPRLACIPFSLLGLFVLSYWTQRLFGAMSANLVCIYWCLCPNMLAHGQTILPDVAASSLGVVASYLLWNYIQVPSTRRALAVGVGLGVALLSKLTWLVAIPVFPFVAALCAVLFRFSLNHRSVLKRVQDYCLMLVTAGFVLNLGYAFENTCVPLGDYTFCSEMLGGHGANPVNPGNRFTGGWLASLPVPVPANYLLGVDYLRHEVEKEMWSFLLGEWKYGSWPHYYVVAFLVKTPEATLCAALMGLYCIRYFLSATRLNAMKLAAILTLALPSGFAFVSVSVQGGFNHHHRYILMCYPGLFFLAAIAADDSLLRRSRSLRQAAIAFASLMVVSSLSVAPHFLSYFNFVSGGPSNGWRILNHSNVDWGQDLLYVDRWLESHPECRPVLLEIDYLGQDKSLFGMDKDREAEPIGSGDRTDFVWFVISVRRLLDRPGEERYAHLQRIPVAHYIGYSFRVYKLPRGQWPFLGF